MRSSSPIPTFALFAGVALLAACGGGGGGGGTGGPLPPTTGVFPTGLPGQTASPPPSSNPSNSPSSAPSSTPPSSPGTSPSPGSSATPGPGSSSTPGPGSSSTPGPTPTPTAVPTGYYAKGIVRDIGSGLAISGATVILAPPIYAGATPPPVVNGAEATTAPDGSFTLTGVTPGSNYLEVFENGYASIHKPVGVTTFDNELGALNLTRVTADEAAWLQKVNSDRAQYGGPAVVLDEILQEAAQHWADYMATYGYYNDTCAQTADPNCQTASQYEQNAGAQYTNSAQNIYAQSAGSTWTDAENSFLAESNTCPQPTAYKTCQGLPSATHFDNLINPKFVWIGLAEHKNGNSYNPSLGPFVDYYTQEFGTPFQ